MSEMHPLVDPKQRGATHEMNHEDIQVIRSLQGEERDQAIERMVSNNIPLVMLKVDSCLGLFPEVKHLFDDLVSVGLIALFQSIKKLADLGTPPDGGNPTGFIGQRIIWAIGDFLELEADQKRIPPEYHRPYVMEVDPTESLDTIDLIMAVCYTEEERILVNMRYRGCVDEEIAKRLSITTRAVCAQRHEIMSRYETLRANL